MTQPFKKGNRYSFLWIAFLVALITFVVYLPALQNGFVNWDDDLYVYEQRNIQTIDLGFLKWIFTPEANATWHPLTLFSLAIDYSIWGLNPFGYHLTNVILHTINTALVFLLVVMLIEEGLRGRVERTTQYQQLKGSTNRFSQILIPAFTASLLFGIHPLHVESVAWVSERKDVLCAFFFLLTLLAYIRYASMGTKRPKYYSISLIFFVLALISKPMAVSLPVVFLILEFFPLNRFKSGNRQTIIIEKIPFFVLSLISSLITISVQRSGGAMGTVEEYPLISRVFVAQHSFIFYLVKMIFPFNLAPFYPYPDKSRIISSEYIGTGMLFIVITLLCIWVLKRNKVFAAVWFYYVVTLIPVIGIVKVGSDFATADRYAYLPAIGPFILAGLGAGVILELCPKRPYKAMIAAALLLASGFMAHKTVRQISVWHDSIVLWSHEIKLFPYVDTAYYNRGEAYSKEGDYQQALKDTSKAIELNPICSDAYYNRGTVYYSLGEYKKAITDYNIAIELNIWKTRKSNKLVYNNRGIAYNAIGQYQQGIRDFNRGIELNPQDEFAYSNRGNAYFSLEDHYRAIDDYNKAIELNPRYVDAYNNRGYVYYVIGDNVKSINDLKKAVELDPGHAEAYCNLGLVYSRLGSRDPALSYYRKAASLGSKEAREYLNKEGINK